MSKGHIIEINTCCDEYSRPSYEARIVSFDEPLIHPANITNAIIYLSFKCKSCSKFYNGNKIHVCEKQYF